MAKYATMNYSHAMADSKNLCQIVYMYALHSIRKILDHLFVIQLLISKPLI